ncbi:putative metal homeostasis protein [Marinilactibacillus piezotolerans]|nr:putative metal homeostasis protein [Marinilactibacillus piezotolerans]
MPEKKDLATARRMMKSPNKVTARRGLRIIKEAKKLRRGLKK